MSEPNLPDEELNITGEDPVIPDEGVDAVPPELIGDDTVSGEEEDFLSEADLQDQARTDQALRDETERARYEAGDVQIPPETPTIGEAAADVDFGDTGAEGELDGSDDASNRGGDPLAKFPREQR